MKWYQGKIKVASDDAEIVAARLLDFGIEGVEIVDEYENMKFLESHSSNWDYAEDGLMTAQKGSAIVKFYLTEDAQGSIGNIREALSYFGQADFTSVEDDWSEAWKAHYKPFKIGKKVVVVPAWEDYVPSGDEIVFKIEPGHVFGTGQHQSTALCVAALEEHVAQGVAMLDIGCGSGILSIISLLLGAKTATAIDIDPSATKVCLENGRLNGIKPDSYKICIGNILADDTLLREIGPQRYDVIAANIVADVIIPLIPLVKGLLAHDGTFIAGGIIKDRAAEVIQELVKQNFIVTKMSIQDEWVALEVAHETSLFCGQHGSSNEQPNNIDRSKCDSCGRATSCGR